MNNLLTSIRSFALKLLIPVLAAAAAAAQEPAPNTFAAPNDAGPPVSLEELVAGTLANNPELRFYEAEIAAARAGRKMAGSPANPELSASLGHNRQRFGGLSAEGIAWSVSVMQPFEWPGRISLRKAIANHDLELAQLGYERFKTALAGRVRTLAYGLFAAQEKSAAATEVAGRFKALRDVLVQRDPAGLTPQLELRVIEATELNAQRKATEALLGTQAALLELNHLRGVHPSARLQVSRTGLAFRPAGETDALLALARTNNFELRARAVELAQQGLRVDLARNERYPAVSIGPNYSDQRAATEQQRIIGVGVSLPLPLWNRNSSGIEAAQARQTQAEVAMNVADRELQRQVAEAALIYETKRRQMTEWRPDAVEHFKQAAALADRHYRLGAVPLSTFVELQKQYLDAIEGLLDTRREALEAATRLELLTGLKPSLVTANPAAPAP
jgi:cobalt-zinc-cadmium efflux system outer membrane protein